MEITFNTFGNEKQKQAARYWTDDVTSDIVYGGSKGSGKSYLGISLIFGDCLLYPGIHEFIARKRLNDIRKFTIPSIHEVFNHWGLDQGYYKFNGQDNYFQLSNGSRVYLLEANYLPSDPLYYRFGSMQMTRGMIEEAGEFEEAAKNNLAASIGRWKNDTYNLHPKLLQTCNPAKNYLYREYYKKHRDHTLEPYKKFIQALPEDNKKLPAGYLENLWRSLSPNERERLLKGNWEYDDDPNALIRSYDKIIDLFNNQHIKEEGQHYITADIARKGEDKTVIRVWRGWVVVETIVLDYSLVTDSSNKIRELASKYQIPMSQVCCDEDGVGGGVVDILSCKGFVNNATPLPSPNGDKRNFKNLKSQASFHLADMVNDSKVFIKGYGSEDDKQKTIEELEVLKEKIPVSDQKLSVLSREEMKELLGRSPDYLTSLMIRSFFDLNPYTGRYVII